MGSVIRVISIALSISLVIIASKVWPIAEGNVKALVLVGIVTAILCIIAVVAWAILEGKYAKEAEDNRHWRMKHL